MMHKLACIFYSLIIIIYHGISRISSISFNCRQTIFLADCPKMFCKNFENRLTTEKVQKWEKTPVTTGEQYENLPVIM